MRGKVLVAVVIFASSFVWGQTNVAAPGQKPGPITDTPPAKTSQSARVNRVELTGMELRKQGELTTCRRDCELTLRGVLVRASEIDYHSQTGEADARGNVRITITELPNTAAVSHQP